MRGFDLQRGGRCCCLEHLNRIFQSRSRSRRSRDHGGRGYPVDSRSDRVVRRLVLTSVQRLFDRSMPASMANVPGLELTNRSLVFVIRDEELIDAGDSDWQYNASRSQWHPSRQNSCTMVVRSREIT